MFFCYCDLPPSKCGARLTSRRFNVCDIDLRLQGHSTDLELLCNLNTIGNHCVKCETIGQKEEFDYQALGLFFLAHYNLLLHQVKLM